MVTLSFLSWNKHFTSTQTFNNFSMQADSKYINLFYIMASPGKITALPTGRLEEKMLTSSHTLNLKAF